MADRGGARGGGFASRGDRGGDRGRGRGRGRGRRGGAKDSEKEWQPVTKLGRLVKAGKIKSMEEIYLHSLPIKEYQIVDFFLPKLKDEVMKIKPVQKQTRAGQRTRFKAIVIIGDSEGHVGLGIKTSKEVATAIRAAIIIAKLSVIPVRRGYWGTNLGLPHSLPVKESGKCGSVTVRLIPAPRGTQIVASPAVKRLLQLAGIEDAYTSSSGSTKTLENTLKATFAAISNTYGFLTPNLWTETKLIRSPLEEYADTLREVPLLTIPPSRAASRHREAGKALPITLSVIAMVIYSDSIRDPILERRSSAVETGNTSPKLPPPANGTGAPSNIEKRQLGMGGASQHHSPPPRALSKLNPGLATSLVGGRPASPDSASTICPPGSSAVPAHGRPHLGGPREPARGRAECGPALPLHAGEIISLVTPQAAAVMLEVRPGAGGTQPGAGTEPGGTGGAQPGAGGTNQGHEAYNLEQVEPPLEGELNKEMEACNRELAGCSQAQEVLHELPSSGPTPPWPSPAPEILAFTAITQTSTTPGVPAPGVTSTSPPVGGGTGRATPGRGFYGSLRQGAPLCVPGVDPNCPAATTPGTTPPVGGGAAGPRPGQPPTPNPPGAAAIYTPRLHGPGMLPRKKQHSGSEHTDNSNLRRKLEHLSAGRRRRSRPSSACHKPVRLYLPPGMVPYGPPLAPTTLASVALAGRMPDADQAGAMLHHMPDGRPQPSDALELVYEELPTAAATTMTTRTLAVCGSTGESQTCCYCCEAVGNPWSCMLKESVPGF
ncbi:hypothetical protein DL767_000727 [Monosporascus sp. MG133]|nr:hypothetical protein DL767_000727 [Monosporascus sp. MG133]